MALRNPNINVNDLETMSLKDLLSVEADIQEAITSVRERERVAVREQMAKLAERSGFDLNELMGNARRRRHVKPSKVLYRDPNDSNRTWTGRGRKPNWLVAAVDKGKKVEDFLANA